MNLAQAISALANYELRITNYELKKRSHAIGAAPCDIIYHSSIWNIGSHAGSMVGFCL